MKKEINAQAERHKREAVWFLIAANGTAQGYKPRTLRDVNQWYLLPTEPLCLAPKAWQEKMAGLFDQLVTAAQMQQIDSAVALYLEGDDSELRPYIKQRTCVEFGTITGRGSYGPPGWRSRKFSDPLYLTPAGFLRAYPEKDEDLFIDSTQAQLALDFYRSPPNGIDREKLDYSIFEPAVLGRGRIGGKAYQRWLKEVKGQNYTEPRRSLAESHELYQASGREGLEKLYSRAYVFALVRKFNAEGLEVKKEDFDRIVHPRGYPATA